MYSCPSTLRRQIILIQMKSFTFFFLAPVLKKYARGIWILKEHSIFSLFLRMKNKAMEEQQPKMKTSEHNSLEINAEHGLLFREFSCPVTYIHNSYAIFSSSYRLSNVLINFKIKNWHIFNYLITEKLLFSSKFAFINFSRNSLRYQTLKKLYLKSLAGYG